MLPTVEIGGTMRNVWFAFLIVLFAVLVTKTGGATRTEGGTTSATNTRSGGSGGSVPKLSALVPKGAVYCTVLANAVHADGAGKQVLGSGRFRCDRPGPDSLAMTVSLQKRDAGGRWTTVATQKFTASGTATTRDASDAARTREITASCAPGAYRTVVSGTSVSQKKSRTYTMTSPTANDPCTRLKARR
jgi:hypothetical protein